jgi:ubiquinone/menaquinone biosynthesis C-methylase UbiE
VSQLAKVHCPDCRGSLRPVTGDCLACENCQQPIWVRDGVLDFVRGRRDTALDPQHYDAFHGVDDERSEQKYRLMRRWAGERWPDNFGSVLEVGCGTGLFSRALVANGAAREAVLTDVSTAMLGICRRELERRGLLARIPVAFATYSGEESAFRDAVFDTCAGTSVLHHILDVRGFLAEMFRMLKPGGRAFFAEPNLRFHRALMQTLADVLAALLERERGFSQERQALFNILAEARRGMLHQGDLGFLAGLEDKHMFLPEIFERMGLELGFASAAALPDGRHPTGVAFVAGLCGQIGVGQAVREEVLRLLPAYSTRYLALLRPEEQCPGFLLWLEKGIGPQQRSFRAPLMPSEEERLLATRPADPTGGLPARYALDLQGEQTAAGIALHVAGWCLVNADVLWLRVILDGVAQDAPVWRPRPDVQQVMNGAGLYPAWNALCSGVEADLVFEGLTPGRGGPTLQLAMVLASGAVIAVPAPDRLALGEQLRLPP